MALVKICGTKNKTEFERGRESFIGKKRYWHVGREIIKGTGE